VNARQFLASTYGLALRALLPRGVAGRFGDEAEETALALAADARRRGRLAECAYWRDEFLSLARTAWTARRTDPAPEDDISTQRTSSVFGSLMNDVRYALRLLRRAPGFTAVAIVTLAIGIGANTAIFSVVNGVLLRPLPYRDPDRLFVVQNRAINDPTALSSVTPATFYDLQRGATGARPMAACYRVFDTLTGRGEAERFAGVRSAGSILEVLGVQPLLGRAFSARDDEPGAAPVVVLGYSAWQRLFQGDTSAVGSALTLNGSPHTVVGIMPPDFQFPDETVQFWAPAQFSPAMRASRTEYFLFIVARLQDNVEPAAADAELQTVMARLRKDFPDANSDLAIDMRPVLTALVDTASTRLWILMASVACVLLIACANLGNLLLARAAHRTREISVRQAIGAGRGRIARQLLTESVVLSATGGLVGVIVGHLMLNGLKAWLPGQIPRLSTASIDMPVLLFTLAVSMIAGVVFGMAPSVQLAWHTPSDGLREGARASAGSGQLRSVLVVGEIAIALVLLAGAGLLIRSYIALQGVDPGFPVERLMTLRVGLGGPAYSKPEQRIEFVRQAVERLSRLPGVQSAAAGSGVPIEGRGTGAWFNIISRPVPPGTTPPAVPYRVVTPGYLQTVGIGLVRGRLLSDTDGRDGTPSVVISDSVARRFWPDRASGDPIGAEIYLGAPDNKLFDRATIVGIVRNVKLAGLDGGITDAVYGLNSLMPFWSRFTFVLRTNGDPTAVAPAARREIRDLDALLPVTNLRTMTEIMGLSVAPARGLMLLLGLLAGVALVMAVIGVFGVLSYTVSRRAREMGIRVALGADAGEVLGLVMRQGLTQSLIGVLVGVGGALLLTRFMETLLFNVSPTDTITLLSVSALLLGSAALACYLPARRATRVDPLVVLRTE
jgi:putative ABC transport system permease protein